MVTTETDRKKKSQYRFVFHYLAKVMINEVTDSDAISNEQYITAVSASVSNADDIFLLLSLLIIIILLLIMKSPTSS